MVAGPAEIIAGTLRIAAATGDLPAGSEILWHIRPDRITVGDHGGYGAAVLDVADIGTYISITVQLAGRPGAAHQDRRRGRARTRRQLPGLGLDPGRITLWPASDEFRDRLPS